MHSKMVDSAGGEDHDLLAPHDDHGGARAARRQLSNRHHVPRGRAIPRALRDRRPLDGDLQPRRVRRVSRRVRRRWIQLHHQALHRHAGLDRRDRRRVHSPADQGLVRWARVGRGGDEVHVPLHLLHAADHEHDHRQGLRVRRVPGWRGWGRRVHARGHDPALRQRPICRHQDLGGRHGPRYSCGCATGRPLAALDATRRDRGARDAAGRAGAQRTGLLLQDVFAKVLALDSDRYAAPARSVLATGFLYR
mmetsp:Transcript_22379/g.51756  ORF Transcript_22379/g.51756 Transcript_22379/m.51756 type:complete len:250 (+) Transcript_22379:157-906(+)